MTSEKFTYYVDFGDGFVKTDLSNLNLKHKFTRDDVDLARIIHSIEGDFLLSGSDFIKVDNLAKFGTTKDVSIQIYENGDINTGLLVYEGWFNKFNDFDYNQKLVKIKEFHTDAILQEFLSVYEKDVYINNALLNPFSSGFKPIYCNLSYSGKKITDLSQDLPSIINNMIYQYYDAINLPYICDPTNFWYNTSTKKFDADKYRIANLRDINGFGTGNYRKLSLKRLFEALRIMHKIYWYIDLGRIKFKTLYDLDSSRLDLSEELINKNQKFLNYGLNIKSEGITFNDNNSLVPDDKYIYAKNKVIYTGVSSKSNDYNLSEFCTRYTEEGTDYNTDGFFLAYVDPTTNKMLSINQEGLSSNYDNCKLSLRSLMLDNYLDYTYIDNENYSVCGNNAILKPFHIAPFIEMPEVQIVLNSIHDFIDSYICQITNDNRKIVLVYEQITDLKTNQTILKGYEFCNTKYYVPPVLPPPPPKITDELSINPTQLIYNENGSSQLVVVTSNVNWNAVASSPDITLSVGNGSAGNTNVTVSLNASAVQRYLSVLFSTSQLNRTLNLIQSITIPPTDVITVTPGYIEVDRNQNQVVLNVVASGNWSITQKESWMSFTFLSGSDDLVITMTVDASIADRTGTATFTCGTQTCTIYVQQRLNLVALDVTPENLSFLYYGQTKSFDIVTPGDWLAASSQPWCVIYSSSGTGNTTINVTCGAALVARSAIITITNGSVTKYVNVVQDGEPNYINTEPTGLQFDKNGGTKNVVVNSNTNWQVIPSDSWITCSVISGSGNGNFNVTVPSTIVARNSTVVITDGTIIRNVIIGQSYVVDTPSIVVTPGYNSISLNAQNILLTIVSNAFWQIISKPSWINFQVTFGTGDAQITMEVSYSASPRSGTVTFEANLNGTLTTIGIYVSQH